MKTYPRVLTNAPHSVNIIAFIATGLSYALLVSSMFNARYIALPRPDSGQGGDVPKFPQLLLLMSLRETIDNRYPWLESLSVPEPLPPRHCRPRLLTTAHLRVILS